MDFRYTPPVNRVAEALTLYAVQEAQRIAANPVGWRVDQAGLSLKLRFYEGIAAAKHQHMTRQERRTLQYVRHEVRKMRAALQPTAWNKFYYHPATEWVKNVLLRRQSGFGEQEAHLRSAEGTELKTLNLHALQQALTSAGFRLPVETVLRKMLDQRMPHFHFRYADPVRCKNADFVLHFTRIPGSEFYFFHSFDAVSRPDLQTLLNRPAPAAQQTFYLSKDIQFSATEAATLVNGGYVSHMTEGHEQWYSLNLQPGPAEGRLPLVAHSFDLAAELKELPMKPLSGTQAANLLRDLREGQPRSVDLKINGQQVRCKVQVEPHKRTLSLYDERGQKINVKKSAENASARSPDIENGLRVLNELEEMTTSVKKNNRIL